MRRSSFNCFLLLVAILLVLPGCTTCRPVDHLIVHVSGNWKNVALTALREASPAAHVNHDGNIVVPYDEKCRVALIRVQALAEAKMEVAWGNAIHENTTRDENGKPNPYRRRIVIGNADGFEFAFDDSPFLRRYDPGHPDADSNGMVRYPNVDYPIEYLDYQIASFEYEVVTRILQRLDPSYLAAPLSPFPSHEKIFSWEQEITPVSP